jgi:hypothetical protein
VPPEEGDLAQFVFRAPYSRWKQVIRRELEPVRGMMQGNQVPTTSSMNGDLFGKAWAS